MSVFDEEVAGDMPDIFADAGDLADYQGASDAPQIRVVVDRDWEVYDDDQVPMRVTAISVMVADAPVSRMGDTVALPDRTWTVQQILEDDGFVRRLYVS